MLHVVVRQYQARILDLKRYAEELHVWDLWWGTANEVRATETWLLQARRLHDSINVMGAQCKNRYAIVKNNSASVNEYIEEIIFLRKHFHNFTD
jgi:hypothetical protein